MSTTTVELKQGSMLRLAMVVLWPSFLVAILAEGFFFSVFHPDDLVLVDSPIELSPVAVYTIGFFCFWVFCALASMLSCYLNSVPNDQKSRF